MPKPDTILELACLAGTMVIRCGGETSRAEDTVQHIFTAAGYPDSQMSCQPTVVTLTLVGGGERMTMVSRVGPRTIDMSLLEKVNAISRSFSDGKTDADTALMRLRAMAEPKPPVSLKTAACYAAATAFSVAAFAVLFGGNAADAVAAGICGMLVSLMQSAFSRLGRGFIDQFLVTMLGGAVIGALAVTADLLTDAVSVHRVITGAIMPLLPGLALTVAIRDTIVGDLVSGVARLAEVVMTALALAGGMGAALYVYMLISGSDIPAEISPKSGLTLAYAALLLISGFAATAFYQLPWNAPKKAVLPAAAVGAVTYAVFAVLNIAGQRYLGYFAATLLASASSNLLARRLKMPSTLFLFPGLIPLVPGMGIYETMLCIVRGETVKAMTIGGEVLICAALMAFAAAMVGAVTGKQVK